MRDRQQLLVKYFKDHGGISKFSDILKNGFHPDSLSALLKSGQIEKIGKGLYCLNSYSFSLYSDLVSVAIQSQKGVICLLSALSFHEVTNEVPSYVDIAIQRNMRENKIKYPPVKFHYFSPKTWREGIEKHVIDGHEVKIYSLPKTIADCFKFRNKIGADVVRNALKTAIAEKKAKPIDIMRYTKICRVDKIVKPILEAIL